MENEQPPGRISFINVSRDGPGIFSYGSAVFQSFRNCVPETGTEATYENTLF